MSYKFLFIFTLILTQLNATSFKEINPTPSKTMLKNQLNAKVCSSPKIANEKISETFKYGCFCGKHHPNSEGNTTASYKKLNKKQRIKVIENYYKVKPYDDIDAVCQQHDMCYFYQGKNAKVCNDAIYDELHDLVDTFKSKNDKIENRQCQHLSYDVASVFNTIFTSSPEEDSIFEIGSLLFNTAITLANKTFEESIDTMTNKSSRYPKKDYKCLRSNLE